MSLLDNLVNNYFKKDLAVIFTDIGIDTARVSEINRQILKEVTLAQWLLESTRGKSDLAVHANNFAGLKWRDPDMRGFAEPLKIKVPSESEEVEFCKFTDIDAFIIGYWKFLTRTPYKGLEDHTNTPENFLGFLKGKGYSSDPNYVNKVVNLLPEAQNLLANVGGVTIAPVEKLQLIRAPKEVEVGQSFRVEGIARLEDSGKILSVMIDDKFPAPNVAISQDGKWQFDLVFKQEGDRRMIIAVDDQTLEIQIKVVVPFDHKDDENTQQPTASSLPGAKVIKLGGSVGIGGVNKADDVKAIKARLHELGYTWVGDPNRADIDRGLFDGIKLFQSIIAGRSTVNGDGRVDVGGITHRWLQAANAPRWELMPKSDPVNGFVNGELEDTQDNHDFGTHWLADVIKKIAQDYQNSYRNTHPTAAPFAINDVSLPHGGDTPDHHGHETGMMCDIYLPKKNRYFGGIIWSSSEYDQDAARAILKSIQKQKLVRAVFFNDQQLIKEKLCVSLSGHDNHIHFEINPPVRS
ncbi:MULTISPECIES: glucosaminidase domain-containing protein [Nostoc]|uniref:Glucosaminidase domain-containing protein n=2 Tax=Nostoc TaxID=1177 RepID=A0ABR8ICC4_9NOSO|nr:MULTISPECIES: glucosaminidase domain-containing protein [Nostoc]MBD2561975.1 glucosaminidase domain-containing protein [Nostoc linckia FACHB-391]MBD2648651.1 glucosaminidase domain-containing protein [Nostoc foliaceum FACHB-393]